VFQRTNYKFFFVAEVMDLRAPRNPGAARNLRSCGAGIPALTEARDGGIK
jgi:hypothetical protein